MPKTKKYICILAAAVCLAAAGWLLYPQVFGGQQARQPAATETAPAQPTPAQTQAAAKSSAKPTIAVETPAQQQTQLLRISIRGKVLYAGEYYIKAGSTIADAIEMAGGLLEGADTSKLDMDSALYDNQYIGIP